MSSFFVLRSSSVHSGQLNVSMVGIEIHNEKCVRTTESRCRVRFGTGVVSVLSMDAFASILSLSAFRFYAYFSISFFTRIVFIFRLCDVICSAVMAFIHWQNHRKPICEPCGRFHCTWYVECASRPKTMGRNEKKLEEKIGTKMRRRKKTTRIKWKGMCDLSNSNLLQQSAEANKEISSFSLSLSFFCCTCCVIQNVRNEHFERQRWNASFDQISTQPTPWTLFVHRRWNAHIKWMGSLFSVNGDSSHDSRNSSSTRYSGHSSVRFIRTNCTHIDITLTLSNVLDRYQKYLDVKFSMFRELIKLGRNNRSKCALWLKRLLFAKSLFKSSVATTTKEHHQISSLSRLHFYCI